MNLQMKNPNLKENFPQCTIASKEETQYIFLIRFTFVCMFLCETQFFYT